MGAKRPGPTDDDATARALAAALGPHVERLADEAAEREAERAAAAREAAERASVQRLDEAALMQLIFAHLDDDNPRVVTGIDFERIVVLERRHVDAHAHASEPAPARPAPRERRREPPPSPALPVARLEQHEWSGRGWVDDVRAIDPALLDRPELDAAELALLRRTRKRPLPCLYLRLLDRAAALRHLDVFADACRRQPARYVRVITGKGINSFGEPVLKRTVLGWCDEGGFAHARELDHEGEWGALIIDIGPPR